MEMKATLQKPYFESQRLDFIVEQNHTLGYEIRETETALEAWGYTDDELAQQNKEQQIVAFKSQLDELDLKEIRPLAAKASGTATEEDDAKLAVIEAQKQEIRQQIKDLQGE